MQNLTQFIEKTTELCGSGSIRTDKESLQTYGKDWLKHFQAAPAAILFPKTIEEVTGIVQLANEFKVAIVPSGGRTGLSGGATATNGEVVLSLENLRKIHSVNTVERTVTCQAGVVTAALQEVVAKHNLYLPIDFASKGSSHIGGNIATNAGGIRVIRWGMTREWVLGLKVVTGAGELLELNGSLIKNQSGYDFRSLFIGSEGTLGIIVEATLRLTTPPGNTIRLLCGVSSDKEILPLFKNIRETFPFINAFEYFSRLCLELVMKHHKFPEPLSEKAPTYLLVELEPALVGGMQKIEETFSKFLEDSSLIDVVISQSQKQADALLAYRELISETSSTYYTCHKNDISVPTSKIPEFLSMISDAISQDYPGIQVAVFGHIGDGNLHVNFLKPEAMPIDEFFSHCKKADHKLFALIQGFKGSISAEHGVGLLKKNYLTYTRSNEEIALMKNIKSVFDPNGILNPGKIFD